MGKRTAEYAEGAAPELLAAPTLTIDFIDSSSNVPPVIRPTGPWLVQGTVGNSGFEVVLMSYQVDDHGQKTFLPPIGTTNAVVTYLLYLWGPGSFDPDVTTDGPHRLYVSAVDSNNQSNTVYFDFTGQNFTQTPPLGPLGPP